MRAPLFVGLGFAALLGAGCDGRAIRAEHRALFAALPPPMVIPPCDHVEAALGRQRGWMQLIADARRTRNQFDAPLSAELEARLAQMPLDGLVDDFTCVLRDPARRPKLLDVLGTTASLLFDRADLEAAHDAGRGWAWALAGLRIYPPLDPAAYTDYFNPGYFFDRVAKLAVAHPPDEATRPELLAAIDAATMSRAVFCAGFEQEDVGTGGVEFAGRLKEADRDAMKARWGADPLLDDADFLAHARPSLAAWRARRAFFDPLVAACARGGDLAPAIEASRPALEKLRALDGAIATMSEVARDRLTLLARITAKAAAARRALGGS